MNTGQIRIATDPRRHNGLEVHYLGPSGEPACGAFYRRTWQDPKTGVVHPLVAIRVKQPVTCRRCKP